MLANDADESSRILFDLLILIGHVDMTEGLNEKSAVTLKWTDSSGAQYCSGSVGREFCY